MGDEFDVKARDLCVAVRRVRDAMPGYIDGLNAYLDAIYNDPTGYVPGDVSKEFCNTQMALYTALRDLNRLRFEGLGGSDDGN